MFRISKNLPMAPYKNGSRNNRNRSGHFLTNMHEFRFYPLKRKDKLKPLLYKRNTGKRLFIVIKSYCFVVLEFIISDTLKL